MMLTITENSTLADALAQLDGSSLQASPDEARKVINHYDWRYRLSLKNRLEAVRYSDSTTEPEPELLAKIGFTRHPTYRFETPDGNFELHFVEAYGAGWASVKHYTLELRDGGGKLGTMTYFPNNNFVFTNKETCTSLIEFCWLDELYYHYRAEIPGSWLWQQYYCATTTSTGQRVALSAEDSKTSGKPRIKLYQQQDLRFVALLMALHHGVVFRSGS